jgi:hypothetical protein
VSPALRPGIPAGRERAGLVRDAEVDRAVERGELNEALDRERNLGTDPVLMSAKRMRMATNGSQL